LNIIETVELTKKYQPPKGLRAMLIKSALKEEITAVDKASIVVRKGEIFGFLGPNGAGKTTFIKMLTTLLRPTSGKAYINGFDVVEQEDEAKTSIGLVTGEERSFYWRLSGRQNLQFFASLYGLNQVDIPKRIDELLKQLELTKAADNMFYSYSSGMKQKLALARGLLCNPSILFLDEPTKSVDVMTGTSLRRFIREKMVGEDKRTVFLTTHRLEEVETLCDRLAIIHRGRIGFAGTINELKQRIVGKDRFSLHVNGIDEKTMAGICERHKIESLTLKENGKLKPELEVGFVIANGENPLSSIIGGLLAKGGSLVSCSKVEPKLEELFTDFIKEQQNVAF